jgi:hypothetical protein
MSLTFFTKQRKDVQIPLISYDTENQSKQLLHTVAHGLVSLIKSKEIKTLDIYKPLLKQHAIYYPRQIPRHIQNLPAKEQMDYLLVYTQPHNEVLVPSLAFTLQQMIIDSMCSFPELYGNLLLEGNKIKDLRKQINLDAPCVLQALADEILKFDIFVERYPDAYLLPVKEYYLSAASESDSPSLFIHFQDNLYTTQNFNESEE